LSWWTDADALEIASANAKARPILALNNLILGPSTSIPFIPSDGYGYATCEASRAILAVSTSNGKLEDEDRGWKDMMMPTSEGKNNVGSVQWTNTIQNMVVLNVASGG